MIVPSPIGGASLTEHRLVSFDETPIFYRKVLPSGTAKAVVFLVHGMGEYGGRYTALGEYLAALGIESWIPDLRGFGRSGGKRGYVNHFSDLQADLEGLCEFAQRGHRGLPLFFLGHSFGGLLVSHVAAYHKPTTRLKGLILSSPLFGIAIPVPLWQRLLAKGASVLCPSLTQNNRVRVDMLTHDPSVRRSYSQDSLIHFAISSRLYTEMTKVIGKSDEAARRLHCPVLMLRAGDDKIVSNTKSKSWFNLLSSEDKELETYDGWYHEILNEVKRDLVFARIGQWLIKHI